jgi:hypothetical protein
MPLSTVIRVITVTPSRNPSISCQSAAVVLGSSGGNGGTNLWGHDSGRSMVSSGYRISLVCLFTLLVTSPSFAQSNGFRTRDRQSRVRSTTNRPGSLKSTGEFPAKNLPAEFAILRTRTIFSRDRRAAASTEGSQRDPGPRVPSRPSAPIFRGVLNENFGEQLAGIERGTSSITWYRAGQSLGNGDRVTAISLDQITITLRNGERRTVAVGERLDAGTAIPRDPGRGIATTQPAESPLTLRDDSDSDE